MKTTSVRLGKYRHYKNKQLYEVMAVARHSETLEEMVVYKALYEDERFGIDHLWVRPLAMFVELINYEGAELRRFEWTGM